MGFRKLLLAFLIVVIGFQALAFRTVHAQNTNGFKISPIRNELTVEAGTTKTIPLTIENVTPGDITAKIQINDFLPSDDESNAPRVVFDDENIQVPNSVKNIIRPLSSISLKAKEVKHVSVVVDVPKNTSPGGYYGAVVIVPANANDKMVNLTATVGSLFVVTVPGAVTTNVRVRQLAADRNGTIGTFFISGARFKAALRVENKGNIHVRPFGTVTVKNMFGKQIFAAEYNNADTGGIVLPNSIRKFETDLGKRLWLGRYTFEATVAYEKGTGNMIIARQSVWIIPVWFMVLLLLVVAGAVFGWRMLFKKLKQRKRRYMRKW